MLKFMQIELLPGRVRKYRALLPGGRMLTQIEAFQLLADEQTGVLLRDELITTLMNQDVEAYFWECTSATVKSATLSPFEFVIVPAPVLENVVADRDTFKEKFDSGCSVSTFPNLGGNALLVAPSPCNGSDYGHLARFVRNASREESHELFLTVGQAVLHQLSDRPLWLSTSGAGVYWLHVRLDSRPKYYTFAPYKNPPITL